MASMTASMFILWFVFSVLLWLIAYIFILQEWDKLTRFGRNFNLFFIIILTLPYFLVYLIWRGLRALFIVSFVKKEHWPDFSEYWYIKYL